MAHKNKHKEKSSKQNEPEHDEGAEKNTKRLKKEVFEKELKKLQVELVHLQEWVKYKGLRVVVVFEGRDAAGKGGVIKRITERVSSRVFRVVALPAPSDREKTQLYVQRYVAHMPAAGEVVLFDRSWYNRIGVERVMGFCTDQEYHRFMQNCPQFERALVDDGIILVKYWLSVGNRQQEKRFRDRIEDPIRQWKLSPMDVEARRKWYDYSRARDAMFEATDTDFAPWHLVDANDQRRARLNCIAHLLSMIPYERLPQADVDLPKRDESRAYDDEKSLKSRRFVPEVY